MGVTKKYTRLDVVEAMPMTFGEYYVTKTIHDRDGYKVNRGCASEWVSKEVFESQFIETDDYIGRMKFEMLELEDRINKLEPYFKDHLDDYPLEMQACAMRMYLHWLEERIKRAEESSGKK